MARKVASSNVEITTAQNVVINYELGSYLQRAVASFIDATSVWIANLLVLLVAPGTYGSPEMFVALTLFFVWLYQLVVVFVFNGRSPGMRIMGTQIISLSGKNMEFSDYFLRWIMRPIDISMSLCAVGTFTILATEKRQRLGDMLAGTTVVRVNPAMHFTLKDILTFHEKTNSTEVKYPKVKHLDEHNMLFIKNLLHNEQKYNAVVYEEALELSTNKFVELLQLDEVPANKRAFLQQLVNDYIVLTR